VLRPQPPAAVTPTLHLISNAALVGAAVPGLGVYMHGFYWAVALHGEELLLQISVVELIAIGINLVVSEEPARDARCILCSDSPNSVQVLTNLRVRSPLCISRFSNRHYIALVPQIRLLTQFRGVTWDKFHSLCSRSVWCQSSNKSLRRQEAC